MTPTLPQKLPLRGISAGFHLFSVAEYENLIRDGYLTEDDHLELLEGYLVQKMPRNPPHDSALSRVAKRVRALLPNGWEDRVQCAIRLSTSQPEPDLAIVRALEDDYFSHHPTPSEIGFLVEVADSTLESDQIDKTRIYAREAIPIYWIVNLVDHRIEVYTSPSGPTEAPAYAQRQDYASGQSVPIVLDGVVVAQLPVKQIFG